MGLRAVRTIGIGVAARGWSQVTAMVLAVLAARVLGKQDFGVYAIASVFVILLQALMYGGIYDYIIKDREGVADISTCYWMSLGFAAVGGIGIAALAPIISTLTHSPPVMSLMLALAPSALIASATTWQEALLLRQGRLTTYYINWVITETIACGLAIALLLQGFGLWTFVVYRYAQLGLNALSYAMLVRERPHLRWQMPVARRVFAFSSNIYISRIVGIASSYSADILIGLLVSPASAGAYRLGSRVVLGVSEIAYQPVGTMAWVHFSRANDHSTLRQEWLNFVLVLSVTAWPALAGLALLSHSIVHLLVGAGWDEAVPVIVVLVFARMLSLFEVFLDPMLGVRDRTPVILKLRITASLLAISALAVLTHYGATGAAFAQVLVSLMLGLAAIRIGMRAADVSANGLLHALLPGLAATGAALAGAALTRALPLFTQPLALQLILTVLGGIFVWAIVLIIVLRRHTGLQDKVKPEILRSRTA